MIRPAVWCEMARAADAPQGPVASSQWAPLLSLFFWRRRPGVEDAGAVRAQVILLSVAIASSLALFFSPLWVPSFELKLESDAIVPELGFSYIAPLRIESHFPFDIPADKAGDRASNLKLSEMAVFSAPRTPSMRTSVPMVAGVSRTGMIHSISQRVMEATPAPMVAATQSVSARGCRQ